MLVRDKLVMTFTEAEFGKKMDRCLYDGLIKFGASLTIGTLASLLFFKRKSWPIILATGFGIGRAYSNCEHDLNTSLVLTKSIEATSSN